MSEWKEGPLSDIVEIVMGQSPNGESCNQFGRGKPLLNGPTEFGFRYPKPIQYTVESTKLSKAGDILFCVRGSTTGRMNWAEQEYVIGRGLAAIRHRHGKEYQHFVKGVIEFNLPTMLVSATGSTFPNLSREQLENLYISIPSLPEQHAIASLLSSFDDKIDLLHRQNKTLEAMAETLFRQWFVEGAEERWAKGQIGDLFTLQRGFDLPLQNRIDGNFPVVSASGISGRHFECKAKAPGVVTGRSGLLGSVFYVAEDYWPLNTALYIKDYKVATPIYSFFFLKKMDLGTYNAGSAVPTLNRNHIHDQDTIIPPKDLIVKFEDFAKSFFMKMQKNIDQVRTLEKMRDTLLPKLMSGEVRIEV